MRARRVIKKPINFFFKTRAHFRAKKRAITINTYRKLNGNGRAIKDAHDRSTTESFLASIRINGTRATPRVINKNGSCVNSITIVTQSRSCHSQSHLLILGLFFQYGGCTPTPSSRGSVLGNLGTIFRDRACACIPAILLRALRKLSLSFFFLEGFCGE